ncbi:muscarinic acetylcholine receptor M1-like isoform X2 [Acanthaster planci]|uniref:Muscarinic acetylcholine receptor M1-like isoform X2 n=1 Tax=Acanthaster planci TaxID=133434 RepID=A0A8B7YCS0_ACAPL|nr:muscarinic acetylcholine receptor M1-like isoform X2 [Acanthaster planci]
MQSANTVSGMNATDASPTESREDQPLGTGQIAIAITSSVVCLITVMGNLVVLGGFCTDRRLRTYVNYYIVGLSLADLVAGVFTMPLYTVYWVLGHWPFSAALCDAYLYLNHVFIHISVLGILVLAIDRYQAVYHPLQHLRRRTPRHATFMISVSYVVPFLLWLPWCLLWPYLVGTRNIDPGYCYPQYVADSLAFSILAPVCFFWIPVPITSVLYWRIYRVIGHSKHKGPVMISDLGRPPSGRDGTPAANQSSPLSLEKSDEPTTSNTSVHHSAHENPAFETPMEPDSVILNNPVTPTGHCSVGFETTPAIYSITHSPDHTPTAHRVLNELTGLTIEGKPLERDCTGENHRATRTLTLILTSVYLAHMNSTVNPFCYGVANPLYLDVLKRPVCCSKGRTTVPRDGHCSRRPYTIGVQHSTFL